MPPPSVYMTVSRSGQTRSPNSVMSSPVFPMTVISASGAASFRPRRNRAAPTPPASTVMRIRKSVAGPIRNRAVRAGRRHPGLRFGARVAGGAEAAQGRPGGRWLPRLRRARPVRSHHAPEFPTGTAGPVDLIETHLHRGFRVIFLASWTTGRPLSPFQLDVKQDTRV